MSKCNVTCKNMEIKIRSFLLKLTTMHGRAVKIKRYVIYTDDELLWSNPTRTSPQGVLFTLVHYPISYSPTPSSLSLWARGDFPPDRRGSLATGW